MGGWGLSRANGGGRRAAVSTRLRISGGPDNADKTAEPRMNAGNILYAARRKERIVRRFGPVRNSLTDRSANSISHSCPGGSACMLRK